MSTALKDFINKDTTEDLQDNSNYIKLKKQTNKKTHPDKSKLICSELNT